MDFEKVELVSHEFCPDKKIDACVSIGSIEHLPKEVGAVLLENLSKLAGKLIIIEMPNGFVDQGPADGNPHQIHLSGWSVADFKSRGFKVY